MNLCRFHDKVNFWGIHGVGHNTLHFNLIYWPNSFPCNLPTTIVLLDRDNSLTKFWCVNISNRNIAFAKNLDTILLLQFRKYNQIWYTSNLCGLSRKTSLWSNKHQKVTLVYLLKYNYMKIVIINSNIVCIRLTFHKL